MPTRPTWRPSLAYHPAFGYTIDMESLSRAQAALPPGEFARAYGNRATGAGERVIPLEAWLAARTEDPLPAGRPAYGVAVAADGKAGAVAAAVLGPDGVPWVEIIEHRPGRSWLVDRVLSLRDRGAGVAIDRLGPAAPVADQLDLATTYSDGRPSGVLELLFPAGGDYPAACQDLFDRITAETPRLIHRTHAALDDAADIAGKRLRVGTARGCGPAPRVPGTSPRWRPRRWPRGRCCATPPRPRPRRSTSADPRPAGAARRALRPATASRSSTRSSRTPRSHACRPYRQSRSVFHVKHPVRVKSGFTL
jgi:hypothetical protein